MTISGVAKRRSNVTKRDVPGTVLKVTPRDRPELTQIRHDRKQIEARLMGATEGKPRLWCSEPLLEWTPEKLPGYAEAVAKIERGESLFPKEQKPATTPRVRRSLDSLKEERERLTAQLDALSGTYMPDDPGALSGVRRRRTSADHKRDRKTDADLQKAVKLRGRIDYLDFRILKESK